MTLDSSPSVLILGAAGGFGQRIARSLAATSPLSLLLAGRTMDPLERLATELGSSRARAVRCDVPALDSSALRALGPALVIDTVGPFQGRDRRLARACIGLGIHYIDLADDRDYVTEVVQLDAEARAAGVLVVAGASTVPSLSCAVIDDLARGMQGPLRIDIGIAPGYRGPRGLATIRSILSYVGRPIPAWQDGKPATTYGWSERRIHHYPAPVGPRDLSRVDVPDMALMPARYPGLQQLEIRAGLEIRMVHRSLGALGRLVRSGLLRDLPRWAPLLQRLANAMDRFGSDTGAMHVTVCGSLDAQGPVVRRWTLLAERGDGPEVPATAAVLLARKLLASPRDQQLMPRGAFPATGMLALEEFEREWQRFGIRTLRDSAADAFTEEGQLLHDAAR